MNVSVLGVGLVGSAIVKDLARTGEFNVTAIDTNPQALSRVESTEWVKTVRANGGPIAPLISDSELVVCAVPGSIGFNTLRQIIETGKNVVDISFFPEDPQPLQELAQTRGVTAVVDCGVAPGLCNIIAGYVAQQLEQVERYVCYVGGLPKVRSWPFEYKAVFSPADVLEEYTRPARFVEYGRQVVRPALSDVELINLPPVGSFEAFNTDGLRSLMHTLDAPFMQEKTLRYPGHANLMRVFRESGFLNPEPIKVNGSAVSPLALTSKLLFDQWKLAEGEEDFTVMRVIVEGQRQGERLRYTYDLYDEYDLATQTHSMARTTGYTCTIVVRQVASGLFDQPGICPPELVGRAPGCFDNLLAGYETRNIQLTETVDVIGTNQ